MECIMTNLMILIGIPGLVWSIVFFYNYYKDNAKESKGDAEYDGEEMISGSVYCPNCDHFLGRFREGDENLSLELLIIPDEDEDEEEPDEDTPDNVIPFKLTPKPKPKPSS